MKGLPTRDWEAVYSDCLRKTNLTAQQERLEALGSELLRWNKTHNLTGYSSWRQVAVGLILDSLMLAPFCQGDSCLDIGSGAGFPGLILAMAYPHMQVTLLDARRKRVSFQQHICRLLTISNVNPVWGRAGEEKDPLGGAKYSTVTCKALTSLNMAFALCQKYVTNDGVILLPRGNNEDDECDALKTRLGRQAFFNRCSYRLPGFAGERMVLALSRF